MSGGDSARAFHRGADCGIRFHRSWANLEVDSACDEDCVVFRRSGCRFFGAPVSDTGAGGAGVTRESDSRVDPAHAY